MFDKFGYCQHMGDGICDLEDRIASVLGIEVEDDAYDELSEAIARLQQELAAERRESLKLRGERLALQGDLADARERAGSHKKAWEHARGQIDTIMMHLCAGTEDDPVECVVGVISELAAAIERADAEAGRAESYRCDYVEAVRYKDRYEDLQVNGEVERLRTERNAALAPTAEAIEKNVCALLDLYHDREQQALAEVERLRGESDARGELGLLRLGRITEALSILESWIAIISVPVKPSMPSCTVGLPPTKEDVSLCLPLESLQELVSTLKGKP